MIPKTSSTSCGSAQPRSTAAPALAERLEHQLRPLIHVFTPVFFVMVGVSLDLGAVDWGSALVWQLGTALLVIAVAGKWLAGYCIRESRLRQAVIGISMVPRSEVGLIFAQVGLSNGILNAEGYLPNYDMALAKSITAGVDLWLNTPQRLLEAPGTSGMKAAFNGVPNLSVLDGWWVEGCIEGITGWAIGDGAERSAQGEAESLYHKLGHVFLAMFHEERGRWIAVMKGASSKNTAFFNSQRMMRR